ncbi:hypothetical protein P167DRAFT_573591 [Morchella conica CCBAS932]|uniref:Uncharacterized protein n=1 Tax=Morchella conica CCBAS932 TaxID=1392247 RepID=A0A3N4KRR9_9PEZI|nr:hypothetical protein P167DRAFT_573591 [Morchella conica CCBAS932]
MAEMEVVEEVVVHFNSLHNYYQLYLLSTIFDLNFVYHFNELDLLSSTSILLVLLHVDLHAPFSSILVDFNLLHYVNYNLYTTPTTLEFVVELFTEFLVFVLPPPSSSSPVFVDFNLLHYVNFFYLYTTPTTPKFVVELFTEFFYYTSAILDFDVVHNVDYVFFLFFVVHDLNLYAASAAPDFNFMYDEFHNYSAAAAVVHLFSPASSGVEHHISLVPSTTSSIVNSLDYNASSASSTTAIVNFMYDELYNYSAAAAAIHLFSPTSSGMEHNFSLAPSHTSDVNPLHYQLDNCPTPINFYSITYTTVTSITKTLTNTITSVSCPPTATPPALTTTIWVPPPYTHTTDISTFTTTTYIVTKPCAACAPETSYYTTTTCVTNIPVPPTYTVPTVVTSSVTVIVPPAVSTSVTVVVPPVSSTVVTVSTLSTNVTVPTAPATTPSTTAPPLSTGAAGINRPSMIGFVAVVAGLIVLA